MTEPEVRHVPQPDDDAPREEARVGVFRYGDKVLCIVSNDGGATQHVALADEVRTAVEQAFKAMLPGARRFNWQMPAAVAMPRKESLPEAPPQLRALVEGKALQ